MEDTEGKDSLEGLTAKNGKIAENKDILSGRQKPTESSVDTTTPWRTHVCKNMLLSSP